MILIDFSENVDWCNFLKYNLAMLSKLKISHTMFEPAISFLEICSTDILALGQLIYMPISQIYRFFVSIYSGKYFSNAHGQNFIMSWENFSVYSDIISLKKLFFFQHFLISLQFFQKLFFF